MEIVSKGNLSYLVSRDMGTPHCFTTRLGGVSRGVWGELNLAMHRGDPADNVAENYRILGDALGFSPEKIVMTHQTHSSVVRVVTSGDCRGLDHHDYPACDGLVTREPGVALVVFTADCTPVLLYDPVTGAVGAAHAGWRGTAAGIAGKTVETMVDRFGCDPGNIQAAIGPNIGPCCFETDGDVAEAMEAYYGSEIVPFLSKTGEKYHPDLKAINAWDLGRAGVQHIAVSRCCTACRGDLFWSHRVLGASRGSQGAVIVCKEAET